MKLTVILTGRNDSYASNFKERTLAAFLRNQKEAQKVGVSVEWLFVEWNPTSENYLSFDLAKLGFRCFIVSPSVHKELIVPELSFSLSYAKNVGIRRAKGDWILTTNADVVFDGSVWRNISGELNPSLLYRAERYDVSWKYFNEPFKVMQENSVRIHSTRGGQHFTQAAGDFCMISADHRLGFDEDINFTNIHTDSRFCWNWSAIHSKGNLKNQHAFKFIGCLFKADHPLTYANTRLQKGPSIKGLEDWPSSKRTCEGPALYCNKHNWGLSDIESRELRDGVFYLGC